MWFCTRQRTPGLGTVPVLVSALHDRCGQTQLLPHWPWLRWSDDVQLVFCRRGGKWAKKITTTHTLSTAVSRSLHITHVEFAPPANPSTGLLISVNSGTSSCPPPCPAILIVTGHTGQRGGGAAAANTSVNRGVNSSWQPLIASRSPAGEPEAAAQEV